MAELLIILCPPRSFSSVVSTMIGQHPDLYGFPELHLFSDDNVDGLLKRLAKRNKPVPAGLGRLVAQEVFGRQTTRTALQAIEWIRERGDWSTKEMLDYFIERIAPRIGVEKSPGTSSRTQYLQRAHTNYPDARYLHLTRHPVSARNSIEEFFRGKMERSRLKAGKNGEVDSRVREAFDSLMVWQQLHANIMRFTTGLPAGKTMRVKGEDILSQPDLYLPQIAEWLGIRTDREAIECMKHPEESPYAYTGPSPISGGNDPKFMRNPRLKSGTLREPSLADFLEESDWSYVTDEFKQTLTSLPQWEATGGRDDLMIDEINALAGMLGYA